MTLSQLVMICINVYLQTRLILWKKIRTNSHLNKHHVYFTAMKMLQGPHQSSKCWFTVCKWRCNNFFLIPIYGGIHPSHNHFFLKQLKFNRAYNQVRSGTRMSGCPEFVQMHPHYTMDQHTEGGKNYLNGNPCSFDMS